MRPAAPGLRTGELTRGAINQPNPPLLIRITGATEMASDARKIVERFEKFAKQVTEQGHTLLIDLRSRRSGGIDILRHNE
jgi:hypothetical protein